MSFRFNNNNCQSPVPSARQAAGEGVNGVKVGSSAAWIRPGDVETTGRPQDKTSGGKGFYIREQ